MNWTALQKSLPSRGAWIEIIRQRLLIVAQVSLPSRGAWIEIPPGCRSRRTPSSLPSRGAWIEISAQKAHPAGIAVAPLTGSVD